MNKLTKAKNAVRKLAVERAGISSAEKRLALDDSVSKMMTTDQWSILWHGQYDTDNLHVSVINTNWYEVKRNRGILPRWTFLEFKHGRFKSHNALNGNGVSKQDIKRRIKAAEKALLNLSKMVANMEG